MKWIATLLLMPTILAAQSGWKTVKDKTGSCQLSVPPSWTLLSSPGMVNSPESTTTMVLSGMSQFHKYGDETLKMLDIEKLYENSAQRIFYRTRPNGSQANVDYHVEVPGNGKRCTAQIMLSLKYPEEEAKKIALSLGPVR